MVYVKWLLLTLLDWTLLLTVPVAAPLIAAFTREQAYGQPLYTWGWLWGTWDNPPQGDEGYVAKRSWFPGVTTGFKGYLNRVGWMFRNPTYGYAKLAGVTYSESYTMVTTGDDEISDKTMTPGSRFSRLYDGSKLVAFEYYIVKPWSGSRDLRMRLGWKISTDKFAEYKFAQLVNTINPFDGYGS